VEIGNEKIKEKNMLIFPLFGLQREGDGKKEIFMIFASDEVKRG
jgi:hypothetical protein